MATKQSENGQKKKAPAFSAKIDALCDTGSSTKAFASVCISGRFVVRDIAVMEGKTDSLPGCRAALIRTDTETPITRTPSFR